ncbi:taurine dioxygenase [Pseudomonas sp. JAI111]|uniref:TauD/TfdA dioxygenase family protein n=1 Tax=Pseudomonas sp. JAI111 TaxID=2735913 RepID=UPI002169F8E1|nr:TauD/TfdA family dioxygenase [Pseudomonas sp. JAI111]MCS3835674.1 taurine dioxygenase [Pseudomonas sp. JAI111]
MTKHSAAKRTGSRLDIRHTAGFLGAEVRGIQLRDGLDNETLAHLKSLLSERLVLFFPEQHLSIPELKAFGGQWGTLEVDDSAAHVRSAEDPEVVELKASVGYVADVWHTDLTPMANPPFGSILSMKVLPEAGGDTMWSSQYAAYETLSAPIRDLIDNLTAIHEHPRMSERSEHPVVLVHPDTGRRCLFVNAQYTKRIPQLSQAESDALLRVLFEHSVQPPFTTRRRWSVGDIAIWDNLASQHYVVSDFTGERVIQRVTVKGERVAPLASRYADYKPQWSTLSSRKDAEAIGKK